MKVVLCTIPGEPVHFVLPPNVRSMGDVPVLPKVAIVSLVKWMEKNGYRPEDYDFYDIDMLLPSPDEMRAYFSKVRPDVVGVSAVTSGTYSQVKRLARIVREVCPDTTIVLGGNLSASANVVLRKTEVDLCVVGDGEVAWVKLLNYLKLHGRQVDVGALSEIPGLSFLNAEGELFFTGFGEKLPPAELSLVPDYDILAKGLQGRMELLSNYFRPGSGSTWFNQEPRTWEIERRPMMALLPVHKGCVAKCTFCQRPTKGFRVGNMEELERHVIELKERFNVGFIMVSDENFGSDQKAGMDFARIMKKHDMLWVATGVRCDSVSRELIKFYSENNCVALKFGVESGSQKILDLMEKKFLRNQVVSAVSWCREFKIYSPLAIMFGMPGETEETAKETGEFLADISISTGTSPSEAKDLFYAIPFPGTPLYEYGQQVGVIGTSPEEEEEYLESLFSAPTYKMSYVNLNGAPLREVLFWDVLAQLEAMRHYMKNNKEASGGAVPSAMAGTPSKQELKQGGIFGRETILQIILRKIRTRKWRISVYPFASILIQRKVIPSRAFAKMPRFLLYPVLKFLLLTEYYVLLFATRGGGFNCYKSILPKKGLKRISDEYQQGYKGKKLVSLRTIVLSQRIQPDSVTEESRIKLITGL